MGWAARRGVKKRCITRVLWVLENLIKMIAWSNYITMCIRSILEKLRKILTMNRITIRLGNDILHFCTFQWDI